ncbi:MAG: hypothetical protein UR34_C0008G0006 [candidate division WS6 bacterium GW2011_GWC1_33_20]|uniref:Uncharacterized protein n=1 Tax=candidate division WS6 bacterium GW2011_GWC1_33_20 TaxID=1619089 RepID=A0A0G0CKG8_9BACT|nr:MAG: hypothetical protein UR32_C0006G0017 [candidate division WS6 bacterium GW2011_GWE2_33_157]KKP43947.1 MAG: hypothetical protein UR34_C0008G0006 [candidate division WS6 bacterium GW2011_GWC1_33_20]
MYIDKFRKLYMENPSQVVNSPAQKIERINTGYGVFTAIIIFLLVFIVLASILVVGIAKRLSFIPEEISSVIWSNIQCENDSDDEGVNSAILKNEGWALYQLPEFGFTVELPSYSYNNIDVLEDGIDESYRNVWSIYSYDPDNSSMLDGGDTFPGFEKKVGLRYFPLETLDLGTESNYYEGAIITISFYRNEESLSIEQIEKEYYNKTYQDAKDNIVALENYQAKFVSISGNDAFTYSYSYGMYSPEGYILLNNDYIIELTKFVDSQGEALEVVNKVLDSISFK